MAARDLSRLFADNGWSGLDDLPLVGMVLVNAWVEQEDNTLLFLAFEEGVLVFETEGDCCSNSWIEYIQAPAMGYDAIIAEVSGEVEYRMESDETHDCLKFYQQVIKTTKGDLVIEYRNSSNGYYGGALRFKEWRPFPTGINLA